MQRPPGWIVVVLQVPPARFMVALSVEAPTKLQGTVPVSVSVTVWDARVFTVWLPKASELGVSVTACAAWPIVTSVYPM